MRRTTPTKAPMDCESISCELSGSCASLSAAHLRGADLREAGRRSSAGRTSARRTSGRRSSAGRTCSKRTLLSGTLAQCDHKQPDNAVEGGQALCTGSGLTWPAWSTMLGARLVNAAMCICSGDAGKAAAKPMRRQNECQSAANSPMVRAPSRLGRTFGQMNFTALWSPSSLASRFMPTWVEIVLDRSGLSNGLLVPRGYSGSRCWHRTF
jgi:hypothetical protein